jgi:hypothetical protein
LLWLGGKKGNLTSWLEWLKPTNVNVNVTFGWEKSKPGRELDDADMLDSLLNDDDLLLPEAEDDEDEEPQQCAAETKDGFRCTRNASPGSAFCRQHDE